MTTLLDTNVVIALTKPTDLFHAWAVAQLETAKTNDPPAAICDVSFAEASVAYKNADELRTVLAELGIDRIPTTDEALYVAGQTFFAYRKDKSQPTRDGVLPDFIIGAVAQVEAVPLMTANSKDFVKRYAGLTLIEPPPHPAPALVTP